MPLVSAGPKKGGGGNAPATILVVGASLVLKGKRKKGNKIKQEDLTRDPYESKKPIRAS